MRKTKITLLISLSFIGLFFISTYFVKAEFIKDFNSEIIINKDSSILVKESILYDFEEAEKHGIFRTIPIKYENADSRTSISLEVESVKLDDDFENYEIIKNGLNKEIKIGNSNTNIKGLHLYEIVYRVKGAMNYFKDFDELYWNVTGNSWNVPIHNVNTKIIFPEDFDISEIQKSCYIGFLSSKESCNISIVDSSTNFSSGRILDQSEGLTIAVGFSKGLIYEPSKIDIIKSIISNNIILILPIIVFLIMFFIWRKYGKDPKGYSTIIAQYEPPLGIGATLSGALVDEKPDFKDITAGIIYLAEKGFLRITRLEKQWIFSTQDYQIELLNNNFSELDSIEKNILGLFFKSFTIGTNVKISAFKKNVELFMNDIYKEMATRGFYEKNPNHTKIPYLVASFIFVFVFLYIYKLGNTIETISVILSGAIIFVFGLFMSKKTKFGSETKDYILGFKEFLSVTEKDRLNFHNAPEKKPEQFMKFLPYAIAFGVEKAWAKQFEGLYIEEPKWYSGNRVGAFVVSDFVSNISGLSQSFSFKSASKSGLGGLGGSGLGKGGGGGGSW
jgi:uncharacterized membrane protein